MNPIYQQLIERIRNEISDLGHVVERALRAWPRAQTPSDVQDVYLDSVALNLHGFYSGLERLFELIARNMNHTFPTGEAWHRDLLQQMSFDLPNVRPAVISPDNFLALDEFRRFRHLVRNVYTIHLMPDRINSLMSILPKLWPQLRAELLAFADFIEDLANQ